MINLPNIKKDDIEEIAEQTISYSDKTNKGGINFEEFSEFFNSVLQITI